VAEALVVQNIPERDLIERADELDDGDAGRQNGGAAEEALFSFCGQRKFPPCGSTAQNFRDGVV
jgi:hypothetical protein